MMWFGCLGVAACAGVLSHLVYFIHGEHHKHTLQLIQIGSIAIPVYALIFFRLVHLNFGQAVQLAIVTHFTYLIALWTSMLIYRAFFHRLHRFPGPWYLKLSKFSAFVVLRKLDSFRKIHSWHQKYGNFVRTGLCPQSLYHCMYILPSQARPEYPSQEFPQYSSFRIIRKEMENSYWRSVAADRFPIVNTSTTYC